MALALELLGVRLGEGKQGGDVEHDLLALVRRVEGVVPGLPELGVQPPAVTRVLGQQDSFT